MAKVQIEINECPHGHGFYSIAVGDTRVTPSKCCGSWRTVKSWMVDAEELIGKIQEADFAAMREQGRKNRQKIYA